MTWRKHFSIDLPMSPSKARCSNITKPFAKLLCTKADVHGTYALVTLATDFEAPVEWEHGKCTGRPQDNTLWASITFNVITEKFFELYHEGPHSIKPVSVNSNIIDGLPPLPRLRGFCFWNNNLLLSWHTDGESNPKMGHRIVLKTGAFISRQALPNLEIHDSTVVHESTATFDPGQLFMDDNYIVMPTRNELVLWEPNTQRSQI